MPVKSKNALAREAACNAFADGAASWRELRDVVPDLLLPYLDDYLCEAHVTDAGSGCLMAACVSREIIAAAMIELELLAVRQ